MKKAFKRILVLIIIFIVTVLAVLFFTREETPEPVHESMPAASLPVAYLRFNDTWLEALHGYTKEMNAAYMRDSLTPLEADRILPVRIDVYESEIENISYEVRSISDDRLIESTTVSDWSQEGSTIETQLQLQDLLNLNEEYVLILIIQTKQETAVRYYTRIRCYADTLVTDMMELSLDFSTRTFNEEQAAPLAAYLEVDSSIDNSSLGHVNIHSNFSQLTWGSLTPVRIQEPSIKILEMKESVASFILTYQVSAVNADGVSETYDIEEYFNWKSTETDFYLLAYDRSMQQVFTADEATVNKGNFKLGIISENELPVEVYNEGDYFVFSYYGELWVYNNSKNEITSLYSFRQEGDDGVRTGYDQHDFQVVSVDKEGNVSFIVYGYMNRGSYEGETGILFYEYNKKENKLAEKLYVPYDKPYQIIKEEVGSL